MLPALRSPQPVFEAERHSAASKLSLCPGGTHDAKNVRNRMIVTDYLRSSYIDQMAQKSWKHVKLNCQHSYDCWFLWPSKVLESGLLIGGACAWEFKLYGKMGHPCTCSVLTLAAATHQPRGTERTARALGFSPLPNASNENNKLKVLAAEIHYNYILLYANTYQY